MTLKHLFLPTFTLAVLLLLPTPAQADNATFTITNPVQSGPPGSLLTFNGMLNNGAGMITDIQFVETSLDAGLMVSNIFLPPSLASNGNFTGALFEIMIDNNPLLVGQTLNGSFTVSYTNSGANTEQAFVQLGDIRVTVTQPGGAPIPEPATLLLLGTGLAGVAAKVRRRRRQE